MKQDIIFCESPDNCAHNKDHGWHQEITLKDDSVRVIWLENDTEYQMKAEKGPIGFRFKLLGLNDAGEYEEVI